LVRVRVRVIVRVKIFAVTILLQRVLASNHLLGLGLGLGS
jgi:hypothetical protein